MESIVKKLKQKFRKIRDEMCRWEEIQSRLVSQFSNASAIIQRLPVIQNTMNYGALKFVEDIENSVLTKQMKSLTSICLSMNRTMEEFHAIVTYIEKTVRDAKQLVKEASAKQLNRRIGLEPTIAQCLKGLELLEEIHQDEFRLKRSIIDAISTLVLNQSEPGQIGVLQQFLVDQPNIVQEEVEYLFDAVLPDISE